MYKIRRGKAVKRIILLILLFPALCLSGANPYILGVTETESGSCDTMVLSNTAAITGDWDIGDNAGFYYRQHRFLMPDTRQ